MHRDAAARLGLEGTPISGAPPLPNTWPPPSNFPGQSSARGAAGIHISGIMNPDLMVMTELGVMHRDAAARLGLEGSPISGAPPLPNTWPPPSDFPGQSFGVRAFAR
jgi:hypothetical protein